MRRRERAVWVCVRSVEQASLRLSGFPRELLSRGPHVAQSILLAESVARRFSRRSLPTWPPTPDTQPDAGRQMAETALRTASSYVHRAEELSLRIYVSNAGMTHYC